jgi:hypothetical protein
MIKHSKYGNKKITVNGKTFDSKKEYNRYCELRLLEKAGAISNLQTQVRYVLIPAQRGENGKVIERQCCYIADFTYLQNGEIIAEDTKGFRTPEYILKRKMMLYFHGIRIKEV